ncbi:CASP-like protein 4C1 [Curcuma longa]|uniref:CASP-like protein 4C1 n=1 Tax=Curcuma longa TaxID=136217 RepID=UPI003D9E5F75
MASPLHNGAGGGASTAAAHPSTPPSPALHHRRRLHVFTLLLRLVTFGFALAAVIVTATISSPSWLRFHSFRFVLAANAIVAAYSLFETCASVYQILTGGATLFPEPMQLLFDFAHDQAFAYMAMAAGAAAAADARRLRGGGACEGGFCVQADIAVAMGFAAFGFLALTALVTGYRIAGYLTTGSRQESW